MERMTRDALRGLEPEAQLKALREQKVERAFTIERGDAIDQGARTVWLSIASDQPYERWWGVEVLDVMPGAIRDERLKSGAPLLVGHDPADQVGVVESFDITSDRKLRIMARFGKSARAEEVFRDVVDGIRRNASVGYVIHDLVLEKQEEDVNTYRVTDWEPLEGSLVSIPADPTVGVGRAAETQTAPPTERKSTMTPEEKAKLEAEVRAKIVAEMEAEEKRKAEAAANSPEAVVTRERERVQAIIAAGDQYAAFGGPEVARELIKEPAATVETFKARMLDKMRGSTSATQTATPATQYGSGARVRYLYSKLNAFRDLPLEGGGTMKAEEAAYRSGMWLAATLYKKDWGVRWCRDHGMPFFYRDAEGQTREVSPQEMFQVRAANENVLSAGGALVPIEMEQAIIMLRDKYGVMRRLARIRPMNSDTLKIPRRKGGLQAYFFQDDDGVGITESSKNWDNVTLATKKLGVLARVGRDLIEDAVISVIDDLAQEASYAFFVKEDNCFINGDGTSTYAGMQGISYKLQNTAYVSRIALATGHHTFGTVDNTDLTSVHAGVAQFAREAGPTWLCSGEFAASVFDRLKAIAGGNRVDTLGEAPNDMYLRYPIVTSEAMPTGVTTDYTNKVMALFGRFDMAASVGSRRGIEAQTLVERYAEFDQIGLKVTERFDFVAHDLGSTDPTSPISGGRGPVAAAYGA